MFSASYREAATCSCTIACWQHCIGTATDPSHCVNIICGTKTVSEQQFRVHVYTPRQTDECLFGVEHDGYVHVFRGSMKMVWSVLSHSTRLSSRLWERFSRKQITSDFLGSVFSTCNVHVHI